MASSLPPPKAILFDIGGVVVISPFQAILDYEHANRIPIGWINFSIQRGPSDTGAWQQIERGECTLNDTWFAAFKSQLSNPNHWIEFHAKKLNHHGPVPPVPEIDAKKLFWNMMRISRTPDPWMYPALQALRKSGKFVIGALSNTVVFPDDILDDAGVVFSKDLILPPCPHPFAGHSTHMPDHFDVFVSSAHAGVRKPDPGAYEIAVRELDRVSRERGKGGVRADEVLFLDDIGANLKGAKVCGLRTLKVELGRTREAVGVLEGLVGVRLLEGGKAML